MGRVPERKYKSHWIFAMTIIYPFPLGGACLARNRSVGFTAQPSILSSSFLPLAFLLNIFPFVSFHDSCVYAPIPFRPTPFQNPLLSSVSRIFVCIYAVSFLSRNPLLSPACLACFLSFLTLRLYRHRQAWLAGSCMHGRFIPSASLTVSSMYDTCAVEEGGSGDSV